jgi:hypothetical protein
MAAFEREHFGDYGEMIRPEGEDTTVPLKRLNPNISTVDFMCSLKNRIKKYSGYIQ